MEPRTFYRGFLLTTVLTTLALVAELFVLRQLSLHGTFLALCMFVFGGLCLAIYHTALPAAKSEKPTRLAQYVLVLTFVKMAVGIGLVFTYYLVARPAGQAFLIPFFTAYLGYTVYESWVLLKLNAWGASRKKAV